MIDAVIFDLDGVLLDSEAAWRDAKRELVDEWGGMWKDEASRAMLGMSAPEWSAYMRDELQVDRDPGEIDAEVVKRLLAGTASGCRCCRARSRRSSGSRRAGRSGSRRRRTSR